MQFVSSVSGKINLSLIITGKRNGLHTLDMETVSINLADTVSVIPAESTEIRILSACEGVDVQRFTAALERVLKKFEDAYGKTNAEISVFKRVPLGAGMGGSTACALALVGALAKYRSIVLDDGFVQSLGSDALSMNVGGRLRVQGVGELIEKLPYEEKHFAVLLPEGGVDSAQAYALFDCIGAFPFGTRRNDLEFAARRLNPEVAAARAALEAAGAADVVMTGSGSAVVAVCDSEREAAELLSKAEWRGRKLLLSSQEML